MTEKTDEETAEASTPANRRWMRVVLIAVAVIVIGCTGVCCGGPFVGGWVMNQGPVAVPEIDATWTVRGSAADHVTSALPFREALETQCEPMKNGIRVLYNHLWYNAITDGYDQHIWLQGSQRSLDSYTLYVWGNHVFLRDEVSAGGYVNRVLVCELNADQWAQLAGR